MIECSLFIKKNKKDNGESLAEVLVAILISAVGMLMLSSLIYASTHMIEKRRCQKITKIYNRVNAMEEKQGWHIIQSRNDHIREQKGGIHRLKLIFINDEKSGLMSYEKTRGQQVMRARMKNKEGFFHL